MYRVPSLSERPDFAPACVLFLRFKDAVLGGEEDSQPD